MIETNWVRCPICGSKTRDIIRADTVLENFPVFCPKYKEETLINVRQFQITVVQEPAAERMSLQRKQIHSAAALLYIAERR